MQPSCQIPLIRIIIIIIIALLGKHALTDNSKSDAVSLSITDEVSLQQQAHVGPFESGKEAFTMRIVEGQEQLCTTTGCYPREFQATNQFKPVLDGQLLPPGLHIQVNLATGEKEAKLMASGGDDEQSNDHRSSINVQQQQQRSSASAAAAIVAQVSSESEELPAETPQRSSSSSASNSDRQRIPPAQLYETQVLIQRLACFVYGNPITRAPMYTADSSAEFSVNDAAVLTRTLDDLEALAHHIDIGVWLTQPLPPVECPQSEVGVILSVRSTMHLLTAYYLDSRLIPNGNIRELAARTVGAAIQNNPKVRQWALDAGTVPPILGEGDSESTVHSLMDRLLQLLCGGEERDKAVQSSLIFALLAIVRQNEPAISRLQTADLQCLFQTTVYQNNHLKLLKKGLQLTADLLAFNTPSGFVGHSGHQHRRLPVDWSQLANWVASHFRLFCLQPQGMLLEICLIACEALIALTRSADQQLLRTNVALRDAFDLANHRWFSADGAAAATCAKPRSGNNPLMEQLCMSDEFLHALHEIIPSEIVELSSLAAALFNLQ